MGKVPTAMCAFHPPDTDPAKVPRKEMQLWGAPPWLNKIYKNAPMGGASTWPS